jgi:hypothetical protein
VDFRQELTLWQMTRRYGFHFVSLVSIIIFMLLTGGNRRDIRGESSTTSWR